MDATAPFDADAVLAEAATLTLGAMRVVSCIIAIEHKIAQAASARLARESGKRSPPASSG